MSAHHVVSGGETVFHDRTEAGRLLAAELADLGSDTVVLGIPRGGLEVAAEIARVLRCPMDFILAHKIGAPGNPECAIGAVAEGGVVCVDESLFSSYPQTYLDAEIRQAAADLRRRVVSYRQGLARLSLSGRNVVIADDGAAMGQTMLAAARSVRRERPKRMVVALPVAPPEVVRRLAENADEVRCLVSPRDFDAVGRHYLRFEPVDESKVARILKEESERRMGSLGEARQK